MSGQSVDIKDKISGWVNECKKIYSEIRNLKRFSEEDTKVKFIFPLFEILGWNLRSPLETEMEFGSYDESIDEELSRDWSEWALSWRQLSKGIQVDCAFKICSKPHILLECKKLAIKYYDFPSLQNPIGVKNFAYAIRLGAKHVVFTNFLKMLIIDVSPGEYVKSQKSLRKLVEKSHQSYFENTDDYVSRYDELRALARPKSAIK